MNHLRCQTLESFFHDCHHRISLVLFSSLLLLLLFIVHPSHPFSTVAVNHRKALSAYITCDNVQNVVMNGIRRKPFHCVTTATTTSRVYVFKGGYTYGNHHNHANHNPPPPPPPPQRPLPNMPSQTFLDLAHSQFELLSNALLYSKTTTTNKNNKKDESQEESKIKSIALYLPQENKNTGQLEFIPSVVYPSHPKSGRVFIASDADSGVPPTVPPTLTQLPGFANARTIIPTYPFTNGGVGSSNNSAAVGTPEEVLCDRRVGNKDEVTALSVPLFSGPQTIGVLLIWGKKKPATDVSTDSDDQEIDGDDSLWTERDIAQIKRTGSTLAMALCMDADRINNKIRTDEFRVAIADNLHQVKNPVQALRTFTKLLQRNMSIGTDIHDNIRLVDDMVVLSDRLVRNLEPIDAVIDAMEISNKSTFSSQRFLAPQIEKNNGVHPKLTPTSSYLVKLSPPEQRQTSQTDRRKDPYYDDDKIQIAFVTDVLQPIFSVSKEVARENGIKFYVVGMNDDNELPGVMIYPRALQEAIVNVVENAIKYVKLGRDGCWGVENLQPEIRISLRSNNDNQARRGVTIFVEDNGPGISLEEKESVFKRGYRGTNARNLSVGSGIGLDYSRYMIEKMQGSISILHNNSNGYLQGTVVQFVLFGKINQQRE